jgi:two-component system OmpR family sensor kinase/two-component system sensor histidine kinase BaeS
MMAAPESAGRPAPPRRGANHERRPPHWWPEHEPWPPAGPPFAWRRSRRHFVRRLAILFALLLLLGAFGLVSLISTAARLSGVHRFPGSGPAGPPPHVILLVVVASAIALAMLLATLVRRVGLPLGGLIEAAHRVADGDFTAHVDEHGPPPVRAVARAFNTMTARLDAQDRQRRQLMADIAHELRTPLSVIQGRIEGIVDGVYQPDERQLGELLEETRLLGRLVEDLRTLADAESGTLTLRKEPIDLAMLARDTIASIAPRADAAGVAVGLDAADELPALDVDPQRIREVLGNLLANALAHTPASGQVTVTIDRVDNRVRVQVADTGTGIAPADLPHVFERFYKGGGSRGSGLGLTIARNLIVAHGGEIRADSRPGAGTTMTIVFPP